MSDQAQPLLALCRSLCEKLRRQDKITCWEMAVICRYLAGALDCEDEKRVVQARRKLHWRVCAALLRQVVKPAAWEDIWSRLEDWYAGMAEGDTVPG